MDERTVKRRLCRAIVRGTEKNPDREMGDRWDCYFCEPGERLFPKIDSDFLRYLEDALEEAVSKYRPKANT